MGQATNVVIVDDAVNSRTVIARLLRSIDDSIVVEAFDAPTEALRWIANNQPALIVTDYRMPEMDGVAFIQQVRTLHRAVPIPIIVVSVLSDRAIKRAALDAGANNVIEKPVDHEEFRARARNLLALSTYQTDLRHRLSTVGAQLAELRQQYNLPQQDTVATIGNDRPIRAEEVAVAYDDFFGVTSAVSAIHQLLEPLQEKIATLETKLQIPLRGGVTQSRVQNHRHTEWPSTITTPISDNATELPIALGQVLRELREKRGWSLEYVGNLCNTSAANISKIELGRSREFRLDFLKELACVFGTKLYRLIALAEGERFVEDLQLHSDEYRLIEAFRELDQAQQQTIGKMVKTLVRP